VNPQWHDEFVVLCALFPSGELTEEEWALLQVHLAYCDSCRVVFNEYQQIASDVVPVMAASAASESDSKPGPTSFSLDAAERRLMGRLNSMPVEQVSAPSQRLPWQASAGVLAACVTLAAVLTGLHFYHSKAERATQPGTLARVEAPKQVTAPSDQTNLRSELEHAQQRVAELQQQVTEAKDDFHQSNATITRLEEQINVETAERKKASDERDQLQQQLFVAQSEAQSLRDKTSTTSRVAAQQVARTTSLEARLHDANAAVEEKDRMLALDKEFLAHDREIRDLIGARDLYIADIYDVAQNGKTNKPFGRIFYTKDKSLVFYGYDLDKQSGLKQSVAFQAWGSGDDKQDVSLGLFYQDDTHKRWVLRFNDTKTLAHLNKVFVTAEPQGGSTKPTGKPLLLAYLQMQANHP
jgi:predicted  nucleic acid-binding Zn-ribbon protein